MNKTLFMIAMVCLVLAGLLLGAQLFLKKSVFSGFKQYAWIVFAVAGLSALFVGFSRDTYLPFLGETVMPCSLLKESLPENATHYARVQVHPGAKVLYWAAEPENDDLQALKDWRQAYLGFKNAGVVTANDKGVAVLRFRKPQPYTVPVSGKIEAHVHYRVCGDQGMLGRVETMMTFQIQDASGASGASEPFVTNAVDEEEAEGKAIIVEEYNNVDDYADYNYANKKRLHSALQEPYETYATTLEDEKIQAPSSEDNRLYFLAAETEKNRLPLDSMGIDESPQPAGSEYNTAFEYTIPQ